MMYEVSLSVLPKQALHSQIEAESSCDALGKAMNSEAFQAMINGKQACAIVASSCLAQPSNREGWVGL